jgi:ferredoxin/flavodoxin---NADP+ reductase
MREMSTKLIDSLPEVGGQLTALYPEKFIYDMPGYPKVRSRDLVRDMAEQGLQYGAKVCLDEKAETLEREEVGGIWRIGTARGFHLSRTVVITAGAGGFSPKTMDIAELKRLEGTCVHYFVKDGSVFQDQRVLIVGGGDSAVDWALHLAPVAREVTLIHRRDKFRAHEGSVRQLLDSPVRVRLFHELHDLTANGSLESVDLIQNQTKVITREPMDHIILALGFSADLGPIKRWGVEMRANGILVNSRMETNLPGVYAAGDVTQFDGKIKLIATGVGEATIAVNHAKQYIDPTARVFPGHSSEKGEQQPESG